MKRILAFILAFVVACCTIGLAFMETPATPTDLDPQPSPTEVVTTPPSTTTITVTKIVKGEIWQVRCDTMDNTTFHAGGGRWMADITNHENITSKEGHRSNHCGSWENWVLFVNEDGKATGLYQLKSGSTGGTLPSIIYGSPSDLASISEGRLIYDPTDPNDVMTNRLITSVFTPSNVIPFSAIPLREGYRLFWISQNGSQIWHHTGVLRKTNPRFTIVINGTQYMLGVGETITIEDVEEGLLEVDEIATANYKLKAVQNDGEGHYVVINEIDDPNRPTPTPPPTITTPPPTDPTATPTDLPPTDPPETTDPPIITDPPETSEPPIITDPPTTPTPTPTTIIGHKIWDDNKNEAGVRPGSIFISLYADDELIEMVEVIPTGEENNDSVWTYTFEDLPVLNESGEKIQYKIIETEVDGYEVHYRGVNIFNVYITPEPSDPPTDPPVITDPPTDPPTTTDPPTDLPVITESPTPSTSVPPTTVTPSEVPSETPSATPSPTPSPTVTTSPIPSDTPTKTVTPSPTPSKTPTPTPTPSGKPAKTPGPFVTTIPLYLLGEYGVPLGLECQINHCGDCFD